MATQAFVAIQDLTYTEKILGSLVTVSYINGGTAGSEVVTVSSHAITVQIGSTSTATQVRAAIIASEAANALVTVTISGTAGTAQKTCKTATLAGGVALAAGTLRLGPLTVTTVTGAVAVTLVVTAGGSLALTDDGSGNWTLQIIAGTTTAAQVIAIFTASSGGWLSAVSNGPSTATKMSVSMCPTATAFTGGLDATAASVTVQDLKFAWNLTGTSGNGKTMTYTTGATAGSEVGTVVGTDYNVQIENAVSTATQVKTEVESIPAMVPVAATGTVMYGAPSNGDTIVVNGTTFTKAAAGSATEFSTIGELEALIEALPGINSSEDATTITITAATAGAAGNAITLTKTGTALVLSGAVLAGGHDGLVVTIPGTAGTAQKTVNGAATASGVGNGANAFYQDNAGTALTASFVRVNFSCHAGYMKLICDETAGAKGVIVSFDGVNTHATLLFGQTLELQDAHVSGLWLKYVSAAPAYRLMVVGR